MEDMKKEKAINGSATQNHQSALTSAPSIISRLSTGVEGLDEILYGGCLPRCAYLLRGGPGSGKTTLGLHILATGAARGENTLFITLGENVEQIRANAAQVGIDLTHVHFLDLSPNASSFTRMESYDIFSPSEVEREPITQKIIEEVQRLQPQRVFLDSITQFRYLSNNAFQFHKQVLAFLRFLSEQHATVFFTSEGSAGAPDDDLQFMSDGVLTLVSSNESRTVSITKFRGSSFRSGPHTMRLTDKGMQVFPHLLLNHQKFTQEIESISFGIPALDTLLHGGLERGTVSIFTGPSGVGKTTLGLQFMKEAAGHGEHSLVYLFDERKETLLQRCEAVNIPVRAMMERGTLQIKQVEPLEFSPDEFAYMVRQDVTQQDAKIVMIDSIAGYRLSVQSNDLVPHLHALSKYLQTLGITVILINEVESVTGDFRVTETGISYMADNIVFLRYLEIRGEMHKAIGVLKKRLTDFEKTLREIEITQFGIKVGRPLFDLRNVLSGVPEWADIERKSAEV
ncbi:MAG: ATPase domain-containing protein [Ktedonobacteraceae bacterium]